MKRYTATCQFYVLAENDQDAVKQAQDWAAERRRQLDDWTNVMFISETPFGSLEIRQIYPKK